MKLPIPHVFLLCLPITSALAQQTPLLTFSQLEYTQSLGGGPLQMIHPNEIAFLTCSSSTGHLAEKWSPLTCMQVMAGDENGDGNYWNPALFGSIDALAAPKSAFGPVKVDPRSVFWSPSAPTGTSISASPLRPGDMGRITINGQVELLMGQELFNKALGLLPDYPIDIDAFDYQPGVGIFFSIDSDVWASPGCWPQGTTVRDGDVLTIPDDGIHITWALSQFYVTDVIANGAYRCYAEAGIDAMLLNSGISDRFGAAITQAIDLEALDIIPGSQITLQYQCNNVSVPLPELRFTTQSMTGGSVMTTLFGGSVNYGSCGSGFLVPSVQNGTAVGIQGSMQLGPPSYVNALAVATTERFALEPQTHVLNYGLQGGPGTTVHVGGPWPWVFNWIEIVPPTVPGSLSAWPFSPNCFPDIYFPGFAFWGYTPMVGGFGSFNTPSIPVGWSGKLLFQCLVLNGPTWELSTPTVIDVH
jgi:hypothetical protein